MCARCWSLYLKIWGSSVLGRQDSKHGEQEERQKSYSSKMCDLCHPEDGDDAYYIPCLGFLYNKDKSIRILFIFQTVKLGYCVPTETFFFKQYSISYTFSDWKRTCLFKSLILFTVVWYGLTQPLPPPSPAGDNKTSSATFIAQQGGSTRV